jgi:hypothetical protein
MKNLSTGTGLALLAGAILAWPILVRVAPSANASAVTAAATAVNSAAPGQATPAIVWYGVSPPGSGGSYQIKGAIFRAWSDGRVEFKQYITDTGSGCTSWTCQEWQVFSDPAQGLTYRSDINFDEKVDGADLGQLLADWGNASRQDIPPSDCPLALINP